MVRSLGIGDKDFNIGTSVHLEGEQTMETLALPTKQQINWRDMELGMFCHFGINTFCGQEWGVGKDSPALFQPNCLDARQWARTAKRAGFKYLILTAKHHDGFCLWPTKTTYYSVRSSPWREGQGDVVRECAEACRDEGIGFGIYLSPWDRHEPCYADEAAYDDFYAEQLTELLTGYGPLVEVWFDGAGSEGRRYDWPRIIGLVRSYQPDAMIFNMGAPTIRWVGNEDGVAPYPCWNTADTAQGSLFSAASLEWLPGTPRWVPAECDVPIRKDQWFWHPDCEHRLLPLEQLLDIYYRSVGHGCNLLLNVAPDNRGLLPEADVSRILELGAEIRRRFAEPLAEASGSGNTIELALDPPSRINHVVLAEEIKHGERIRQYQLESLQPEGWVKLAEGSAVGHKKIDRFEPVTTGRIRLAVTESVGEPQIRSIQLFHIAEPCILTTEASYTYD